MGFLPRWDGSLPRADSYQKIKVVLYELLHTGALIPTCAIDDVLEREPRLEALDLAQHVGGKRVRIVVVTENPSSSEGK
jgi:hypothetical protein